MDHQENLTAYVAAFVAELVKTGVKDVVISPGSRSTPMAMVMAEHPDLRIHIHIDERSAAFLHLELQNLCVNRLPYYVHPERLQQIITLLLSKHIIQECLSSF